MERVVFNRKSLHPNREVEAYEKLDGTNLGVRCDGAIYGRRYRIHSDTYQRVRLSGAVPTVVQVIAIKHEISNLLFTYGNERTDTSYKTENEAQILLLPKLVLYGELMCDLRKFSYNARFKDCNFFCFGVVFDPLLSEDSDTVIPFEDMAGLCQRLNNCGLNAEIAPESGRIRVVLSEELHSIVRLAGVQCAPTLDKGPLREVCIRLKQTLLSDGMEGVVLTGKQCLFKWKTSFEDESKGHSMLSGILTKYSEETLEFVGVDISFLKLLMDVATSRSKPRAIRKEEKMTQRLQQKQYASAKSPGPYTISDLEKAMNSATSKYDALDACFDRGERDVIRHDLKKEIVNDLNAVQEEERKCIDSFVNKFVGAAFGKWKKSHLDQ